MRVPVSVENPELGTLGGRAFGGASAPARSRKNCRGSQPHDAEIPVDDLRAEEHPHQAGAADVGAVGNLEIAPELGLRERDERKPRHRAEDGRDDEREEDSHRSEERPDRAHQEHVAHPHRLTLERLRADCADEHQQPEAEDKSGYRPEERHASSEACAVDQVHRGLGDGIDKPEHHAADGHEVGKELVVEVDYRADQHQRDPDPEEHHRRGHWQKLPRHGEEKKPSDRLHDDVARRNRRAAAGALAAQGKPGEDGDVLPPPDRRVALRAVRRRADDRLAARDAPGDDVQERGDRGAQPEGEDAEDRL